MSARCYAIIGTGALGGYYGARLTHAGAEVHFLLHNDYEHVKKRGLRVESPDGDFSISPDKIHAYGDPRKMPRCDVVCACLKTTANGILPGVLPHVVKDNGVVAMMQNGLNVEREAAGIVGDDRVIGGLCFLCSNKIGPGHIQHLDYGRIRFGEYRADDSPGGITDRLRAIGADFERAGVPITLSDDLVLVRWQKLVWNIPYNGLSVALNATTDQLMANPVTHTMAEQLMREVAAGAAAFGRKIEESFIQQMLDDTAKMTPYRTSMKIDYDEGRPMEVESIFGEPVRAAASRGVKMPMTELIYRQLKRMGPAARPSTR